MGVVPVLAEVAKLVAPEANTGGES